MIFLLKFKNLLKNKPKPMQENITKKKEDTKNIKVKSIRIRSNYLFQLKLYR